MFLSWDQDVNLTQKRGYGIKDSVNDQTLCVEPIELSVAYILNEKL